MAELRDYFGDNAFPPKQSQILWQIFEPLAASEFRAVIQAVIEENARTPTIAAFRKAGGALIRDALKRRQQERTAELDAAPVKCRACQNTGLMSALRRESPQHEVSFRCPYCEAAKIRRLSHKIVLWIDELKTRYEPFPLTGVGFERAMKGMTAAARLNGRKGPSTGPQTNAMELAAETLRALGYGELVQKLTKGKGASK